MRIRPPEKTRIGIWNLCFNAHKVNVEAGYIADSYAFMEFSLAYITHGKMARDRFATYCFCFDNQCFARSHRTTHAISNMAAASLDIQIKLLDLPDFMGTRED